MTNRVQLAASLHTATPGSTSQATDVKAKPVNTNAETQSMMSLVDAYASLGSRSTMVTQIVLGNNNQVEQIQVVDSVTHEVIGKSPPDSIARMQQEVQAYQEVARAKLTAS